MSSPEEAGAEAAEHSPVRRRGPGGTRETGGCGGADARARLENDVRVREAYADLAQAMGGLGAVYLKLAELGQAGDEILAATGGCADALARLDGIDCGLADIGRVLENRMLRAEAGRLHARVTELENDR